MGVGAMMFVVPNKPLTDHELATLAGDLGAAFGPHTFWIDDEHHCLSRVDGHWAKMVPAGALEVNWMMRYWGVGYERGDLPVILAVARWLEENVGPVYYGGDCGDDFALFDEEAREKLWEHFSSVGNPYFQRAGWFSDGNWNNTTQPKCKRCGDRSMSHNGGGGAIEFFICCGCGDKWIGAPWHDWSKLEKDEDFFKAADRIRKERK